MAEPLVPGDPRQLGTYYLDGRLGSGGQGVVYEGYGPDNERVAIKALHGMSERDRDLLCKEAELWRSVAPFCTAKVLHVDLDGPLPFVVSEHVAGPDLRRAVESGGPFGPQELRRLAIGVAAALVAIHQGDVVHRDLKPENILLGPDGPRVIDFGLARMELDSTTGVVKGTPRYMPPERYNGRRGDAKVDVWGWGAVVLFAATGRHAFDGVSGIAIQAQVATRVPDTSMLEEPLRSLVSAALSKDPADRPESQELLLDLVGGRDPAEAEKQAASGRSPTCGAPSRAELAEKVFKRLGTRAQEAVPRMFLRLVAPGERAEDTLRSARRTEFADGQTDEQTLEQVLRDFTEDGILVWEDELVTLASAALIRAWPRLGKWVKDERDRDRDSLAVHQGVAGASRRWNDHGRKNSDLLHGTSLEEALAHIVDGFQHLTLNLLERSFLDHSMRAGRRRSRNRTLVSAALAIMLVVAAATATIAVTQGHTAARQRDQAVGARAAGLATTMRSTDPATAKQLAVAATSLAPDSYEARNALLTLYNQPEQYTYRPPGVDRTWKSVADATGHLRAYVRGNEVKIADVDARTVRSSFRFSGKPLDTRFLGNVASLSSDGRVLSLLRQDRTIGIFDTMTGRQFPVTFRAPTPFQGLDRHGRRLVVSESKGVSVWDTSSEKQLLKISDAVGVVSITPDNKYLVNTHGTTVDLWDLDTGRKARTLRPVPGKEKISTFALSPDGRFIALRQGDRLWVGPFGTSDPSQMMSVTVPKSIADNEKIFNTELLISSDSRYVAVQGTVWEVDSQSGYLVRKRPVFRYSDPGCRRYTFGPGDRTLRCVTFDNVVTVVSLGAIRDPVELFGPDDLIGDPRMSQDGSTLAAVVGSPPKVEIWDPIKRVRRGALPYGKAVEKGMLSADGRLLAMAHSNGDIEIWDVTTKTKKTTLATRRHLENELFPGDTAQIGFSPDGRTLAVLTNETGQASLLELWDITSGTRRAASTGQPPAGVQDRIQADAQTFDVRILFSRDGEVVVSAPDQGVVEVATGRRLTAPDFAISRLLAGNKNGLVAASDPDQKIALWDGRSLRRIAETTLSGGPEIPADFSPDGRLLAVADQMTNQIRLWDLTRGQALGGPLSGFFRTKENWGDPTIAQVAFTPDGSAVLAVGTDGLLRTHLIAPNKIKAVLCTQFGPLSKVNWKTHIPEISYRKTC